jgi:hypothetical protein
MVISYLQTSWLQYFTIDSLSFNDKSTMTRVDVLFLSAHVARFRVHSLSIRREHRASVIGQMTQSWSHSAGFVTLLPTEERLVVPDSSWSAERKVAMLRDCFESNYNHTNIVRSIVLLIIDRHSRRNIFTSFLALRSCTRRPFSYYLPFAATFSLLALVNYSLHPPAISISVQTLK